MEQPTFTALQERVEWIEQVTALCRAGEHVRVVRAIADVDNEHLASLVLVLIMARAGDHERLSEMLSSLN
jgi:hypothetical protein